MHKNRNVVLLSSFILENNEINQVILNFGLEHPMLRANQAGLSDRDLKGLD